MKTDSLVKWPQFGALLTMFALTASAMAGGAKSADGGMHSGGAFFASTAHNPWFLKNTTTVSYCLDIDEANFGVTKDVAAIQIGKAFSYWNDQLKEVRYKFGVGSTEPDFGIGTQNFVEAACAPNIDVRFQLGTLRRGQVLPKDRRLVIGAAVREYYDQKDLKARGFIYVAPEAGPFKMQHAHMMGSPWSKDDSSRLYAVIVHELGHVFGLEHGSIATLMDEDFAEKLVREDQWPWYKHDLKAHLSAKIRLFTFELSKFSSEYGQSMHWSGNPNNPIATYFGMPRKSDVSLYYRLNKGTLEFYELPDKVVVGTAKLSYTNEHMKYGRTKYLFHIFPKYESGVGYATEEVELMGEYLSTDGKTRQQVGIRFEYPFGTMVIGGVCNGRFYYHLADCFFGNARAAQP